MAGSACLAGSSALAGKAGLAAGLAWQAGLASMPDLAGKAGQANPRFQKSKDPKIQALNLLLQVEHAWDDVNFSNFGFGDFGNFGTLDLGKFETLDFLIWGTFDFGVVGFPNYTSNRRVQTPKIQNSKLPKI